jgi:purine-binding chemotaxis protein CheW
MREERQFATFFVDGLLFGVNVLHVQEIIRFQPLTPVPMAPDIVAGLINLRGQIVTAIDLRRRLGLSPPPKGQLPMNVVVRSAEEVVSLLVDEVDDVMELGEELFEPGPGTLAAPVRGLLHGVYKLPERLLLVLDTERVTSLG